MSLHILDEMTWREVEALPPARTVALLPTGAVEAHGPHLAVSTDVVIAEAMARAGGERLAASGWQTLLLPPIAYTAAPFATAFPGTVSVRPETVTGLVVDIARSLAGQGFAGLAVANAHLDPAHLGALHAALDQIAVGEPRLPVAFPDVTRKPWAPRLSEEFKTGACHAGRYEGSIVMAARPDRVREALRRALPPVPASLATAIRAGKASFAEAGGPEAYFGWPAEASAEEGRATIATLGVILAEATLGALG